MFGQQGVGQQAYGGGEILVTNDFDPLTGEIRFSYDLGAGNLQILDFGCSGGTLTPQMQGQIDQYLLRRLGNEALTYGTANTILSPLSLCGAPEYVTKQYRGVYTWPRPFNEDGFCEIKNSSVVTDCDAYINEDTCVGNSDCKWTSMYDDFTLVQQVCSKFTTGKPVGECGYDDLKVIITKYPACYKQALGYCVDITYKSDLSQAAAVGDGTLSCTTILGMTAFYTRTTKPTLTAIGDLIQENWFEIAIVVVVILVAAAFAGNKKRR
jgi:hypothetical protein